MSTSLDDRYLEDWLTLEEPEDVLDPELPIVDPHHHLWDLRRVTSQPHRDFLQKVYLTEEFTNEILKSGHKITHTVFAQCAAFYRKEGPEELKAVGEVEFANGVAAMSASGLYGDTKICAGIFSYADLGLGKQVKGVLESLQKASPNFRGIRSPFPSDLNSEFLGGFEILGEMGLTYDNYSPDYTRLPKLAELAGMHPEVTIIVNHLGGRVDSNENEWKECLEKASKQKNVYLKLGGAQQRLNDWEPTFHRNQRPQPISSDDLCERLEKYYVKAIELFGPERCMFESNFPVDKECVSYRTLWNFFKKIANNLKLSETEKDQIFSGTANSVYRL